MMRSAPLKRATFRTRKWEPKPARQMNYTPRPRAVVEVKDAPSVLRCMPKAPQPVRDKAYRALVASLPCVICELPGFSQAAHGNRGKGLQTKTCDLTCFPACHEGANGHHRMWDAYAYGREYQAEREPAFAAQTQAKLIELAKTDPKARRVLERVGILQPATQTT